MKLQAIFFLTWILTSISVAQECTHLWDLSLDTDPLTAKGNSGDNSAAYLGLVFESDPGLRLELKGNYPKARFMSLETYQTRLSSRVDARLDFQIAPDPGSQNPFQPGTPIGISNRSFTLHLVPPALADGSSNTLSLGRALRVQSFLYRIYSPFGGNVLGQNDVPRLFAYDARSGQPRACPRKIPAWTYLDLPQLILAPVPKVTHFELRELKHFSIGANAAVPNYLFRFVRMEKESEVAVIRFKAPTSWQPRSWGEDFDTSHVETRYWSLCAQDVMKNTTLACLPDSLAKKDANGMVTLVFGRGEDTRQAAGAMGYHFIEDRRAENQAVVAFLYRNLLPESVFKETRLYQGDYQPRGLVCSREDFIAGACQF